MNNLACWKIYCTGGRATIYTGRCQRRIVPHRVAQRAGAIREITQSIISIRDSRSPCTVYVPKTQCLYFLLAKTAATPRISVVKEQAHTDMDADPNTKVYKEPSTCCVAEGNEGTCIWEYP